LDINILDSDFAKGFVRMATDGHSMGWHERNGGNLSYRIKDEELAQIRSCLDFSKPWCEIEAAVPHLSNEFFLVTGSGKFFRNVELNREANIAIIELNGRGEKYRITWGLCDGGRPTMELPTHLMNHEVKKLASNGVNRVIYHAHPTTVIALSFVLPLRDEIFTRELWEMMPECPVVFPDGIGVVNWMIPGGRDIAVATSNLMKKHDVAIWAHHGMFCSGENFDVTFGLMHTVEKAAEILVKVLSMGGKRQTTTLQNFHDLATGFNLTFDEKFLFDKTK